MVYNDIKDTIDRDAAFKKRQDGLEAERMKRNGTAKIEPLV